MHVDALTLAAITADLQKTVAGGRVQQVLLTDPFSIGLEVYAHATRSYLLISAQPTAGRIYLAGGKLRRGVDQQTPLLLLLRKYVREAMLVSVSQPDPLERVVRFSFHHGQHGPTTLIAEPMGRSANLILVNEEERILDCVRRVRSGEGPRAIMPGQPYTPPLPQGKLTPWDAGTPDYYAQAQKIVQEAGPLWKSVMRYVAGSSPSLAREVAWRAGGAIDCPARGVDLLAVVQALQTLWAPRHSGTWEPGVWRDERGIVGFSPYAAHVYGQFQPTATISAALELYFAQEQTGAVDPYAGQRRAVRQAVDGAVRKVERRLAALAQDEPDPGEVATLRTQAEWLLALNSQIAPGQETLTVDLGDETLTIALDPARTPVEQAQRMFRRAGKLERAAEFIPKRRASLVADLDYLGQLQVDLTMAENQPEIVAIREELRALNLLSIAQSRKPRVKVTTGQPLRFTGPANFEIVVGRNARQNELVTFKISAPDDLWLHVRGLPGAHVVIRRRGGIPDDEVVEVAAQLAAYYSKARGEQGVAVMVTQPRFVSRAAGGRTGQVHVRNDRTVVVAGLMPESVTQNTA